VFSIALPSAYSRFTKNEGLTGEVMAIGDFNGRRYVGTNHGLFRQVGMSFVKTGVDHACWSIVNIPQGLLAATANGIYRIMADGSIRQQTTSSTTTLMVDDNLLYSGEMDGLYLTNLTDNSRKKICDFEKISKVFKDSQGTIWIQNMYGQVWSKKVSEDHFKPSGSDKEGETVATLVQTEGQVYTVSAETTEPFPYPQFSYYDNSGVTWLTNNEGKGLYRW
jgi:ligand-binding sensor domain-containing protein